MGKGLKLANYITKNTVLKPIYKMAEEAQKEDKKRYAKLMAEVNEIKQRDFETRNMPKTFEVHQLYDSTIHKHDFW